MKSLFKLELLGAILVTLLVLIDSIDVGKNGHKKRDFHSRNWSMKGNEGNGQNGQLKYSENERNLNSRFLEEYIDEQLLRDFEDEEYNDDEYEEYGRETNNGENENDRIIDLFEESEEYKVNPEPPSIEEFITNLLDESENLEEEMFKQSDDKGHRTVKKMLSDDENIVENIEVIQVNSNSNGNRNRNGQKKRQKRKFKFAEAVFDDYDLGEDDDNDINKYMSGLQPPPRTTSLPPTPRKKGCAVSPYDPNRDGPKTLSYTLYEDEVDGKVKQRMTIETDGMDECEVSEIVRQHYGFVEQDTNVDAPEPTNYQDPDEEILQTCTTFEYNPFPKQLKFVVFEEKLNGKVKKHLMVEEDGIAVCQLEDLLFRYYTLHELH